MINTQGKEEYGFISKHPCHLDSHGSLSSEQV
jgi:hypothetical protein